MPSPKWIIAYFASSIALIIALIYSFVSLPFTDDVRVFIGAAKQAHMSALSFPLNIDAVWELKPLGNRALWYVITTISTNPDVIKLLSLLAVITVAALFAGRYISRWREEGRLDNDVIALFVITALITPYNLFVLQAEWWAALASILVLTLLLRKTLYSGVAAGIVSVGIVMLKFSTLFLLPAIIIAYLLIEKEGTRELLSLDSAKGYVGGLMIGGVTTVAWMIYLPYAVRDSLFAIAVAHTTRSIPLDSPYSVVLFFHYLFNQVLSLPVLAVGILGMLFSVIILVVAVINRNSRVVSCIGLLFAMWGCCMAAVWIQDEFFAYHYMVLAFPAIITVLILINASSPEHRKWMWVGAFTIMVTIWLFHCSVWSADYVGQGGFWKAVDDDVGAIESNFSISSQHSVLYLNSQDPPYYFSAPSACRLVGSLPILYGMNGTREYYEQKACIGGYTGEYVIALPPVANDGVDAPLFANESNSMVGMLQGYTLVMETKNFDVWRRV